MGVSGGQCNRMQDASARSPSPSENRLKLPPIEHSPHRLYTTDPLPRSFPLPIMPSTLVPLQPEGAGVGSNVQQSETITPQPDVPQPVHSTTNPLLESAANPLCDDHPPPTASGEQRIDMSAGQQLAPKPEVKQKDKHSTVGKLER